MVYKARGADRAWYCNALAEQELQGYFKRSLAAARLRDAHTTSILRIPPRANFSTSATTNLDNPPNSTPPPLRSKLALYRLRSLSPQTQEICAIAFSAPAADEYLLHRQNMSTKTKSAGKQRSAIADVVAREYTIHLHKRVRS